MDFVDPIHGVIHFNEHLMTFINTPQFQRLRRLRQLGCSYFVFPGASHNRYEHCLGVGHLAGELVNGVCMRQPKVNVSDRERTLVQLAGLGHDLGHGPFSHVFDNEFLPRSLGIGRAPSHEDLSELMLDLLVDDNNIDISNDDLRYVKCLINPRDKTPNFGENGWLFDVVANTRNSIDVDKFDYLARDCHNVGIPNGCQPRVLMNSCRVIDDEICYDKRCVYQIYELFHTRFSLFRQVYTHADSKACEYMVTDALLAANDELRISESVHRAEDFQHLTDDLLGQIERSCVNSNSMRKAKSIVKRLRKHELYEMVNEIIVPTEDWKRLSSITENDVVSCQDHGSDLRGEDIVLQKLSINYAMKENNPVDHVRFFNHDDLSASFTIPRHNVSHVIPSQFQEHRLRIFVRNVKNKNNAKSAFASFLKRHRLESPRMSSSSVSLTSVSNNEFLPRARATIVPRPSNVAHVEEMMLTPSDSPCPSPRAKKRARVGMTSVNLFGESMNSTI